MDDTILTDCYLEVVNKFLNSNYTYKDIQGYWVDKIVPSEKQKEYLDYFYNQINIYEYGHIKKNAIEVIKRLNEFYEIFICSAYIDNRNLESCSKILLHKHDWLIKNLPFIPPENFIFTNRKDIIPADIIIDDKVENLKNAETKLLITAYHNKNILKEELKDQNIIRVENWDEIAEILLNH